MDLYLLNWYEKEQDIERQQELKNQVSMINHELQDWLLKIDQFMDLKEYEKRIAEMEEILVGGSKLIGMGYIPNFENLFVAWNSLYLMTVIWHFEVKVREEWSELPAIIENYINRLRQFSFDVFSVQPVEEMYELLAEVE